MKGAFDRTKVVLRRLPPTISQATLLGQIDGAFAGRYSWVSFCPGKSSQKHMSYSRAYIDFKKPEDVIDFAEFFDGHVFVNEKVFRCRKCAFGAVKRCLKHMLRTQFKVIVEYAPSQRVPKQWLTKDGREGTIHKDSEYLEFLELLAKPAENLPSAEIQLERRDAERSGAANDVPIVTPLMDFVRQKRAAKGGARRSLPDGKVSRKAGASSTGSRSSALSRRSSGKKRLSSKMYVMRDQSAKVKDKSTFILVSKQGDQHHLDKTTFMTSSDGNQAEDESGVAGINCIGKKKVLLLRGRERDGITLPDSDSMPLPQQHGVTSSAKTASGSTALKQNQQHEGNGRIIRSILSNKGLRQSQSSRPHTEQHIQMFNAEKEKRPPRHSHAQSILKGTNGAPEDKVSGNDLRGYSDRQDKRVRHKDKPDHGVWTHRSNFADDSLPLPGSTQVDSLEDMKQDIPNARSVELKTHASGRASHPSENGFVKHLGRRGLAHGVKDVDGYSISSEGKHPRKSSTSVHGSHEKQVWVQKASSGS